MQRIGTNTITAFFSLGLLLVAGCGAPDLDLEQPEAIDPALETPETPVSGMMALARLEPLTDRQVQGEVTFTDLHGDLLVGAVVFGLDVEGRHGFHIHEGTSCDDPGNHLAPRGHDHGGPDDPRSERHKGDLGNLYAGADGEAGYEATIEDVSLIGDVSIVGRTVVVHERRDDLETQPSGDAGDPIACGRIEAVPAF